MPLNPQNFLAPSARFPLRKHRFVNINSKKNRACGAFPPYKSPFRIPNFYKVSPLRHVLPCKYNI